MTARLREASLPPGTASVPARRRPAVRAGDGAPGGGDPAAPFAAELRAALRRHARFAPGGPPGPRGDDVSEERLYAGVLSVRLGRLRGDFVKEEFDALLAKGPGNAGGPRGSGASGRYSFEEAADSALASLVGAGGITSRDARRIRASAFAASQLDRNPRLLYDHVGGPGDDTVAVESTARAVRRAAARLERA